MPGLIDAHAHLTFEAIPFAAAFKVDIGYLYAAAVCAAAQQIMGGFTTIRDVGGSALPQRRLQIGGRRYFCNRSRNASSASS
jgi:imidazolonepropionase-like amidohydrolase